MEWLHAKKVIICISAEELPKSLDLLPQLPWSVRIAYR